MAPRTALRAACAAHRATAPFIQGSSLTARPLLGLHVDINPRGQQQTRSIMKAPATTASSWRKFWGDCSLEGQTLRGFEASCLAFRWTGHFCRYSEADYFECAMAYDAAIQAGATPGSATVLAGSKYDPALIYEAGCVVDTRRPRVSPIVMSMWHTASELGFQPATIQLCYVLVSLDKFGKSPMMKKVENSFRKLVARGDDANAMTVEGVRLSREKKESQAADMLKKAREVGGPAFSIKNVSDHFLGKIAEKQGRLDEAAEYLEAAYAYDPLANGLDLAGVYASINPEKSREILFSAASKGILEAWGRLADLELGMAMEEKDPQKKEEHNLWAMEFQRLQNFGTDRSRSQKWA